MSTQSATPGAQATPGLRYLVRHGLVVLGFAVAMALPVIALGGPR